MVPQKKFSSGGNATKILAESEVSIFLMRGSVNLSGATVETSADLTNI